MYINKALHKYKLTWLCPSISYHVFANLGTKLNADTANKLMVCKDDKTWITRTCNCGPSFKVEGKFIYDEQCRNVCFICKDTCKCCHQFYIGKSLRYWKTRMQEHFRDVWKVVEKTKDPANAFGSDTFSRHFAAYCSNTASQVL